MNYDFIKEKLEEYISKRINVEEKYFLLYFLNYIFLIIVILLSLG